MPAALGPALGASRTLLPPESTQPLALVQVPYPPLVTDQQATDLAMAAAAKVVGAANAQELPQPFM